MTTCCFLLLLICHWKWIRWWGNPTLEAVIQKRLISIIRSLEVDSVMGEPNPWSCDTEKTHFYHTKTKEFVGSTSQGRQFTGRNRTNPHFAKWILLLITLIREWWKSHWREKFNTHDLIATTIVSTSGRQIYRLLHMSLFIMVTSQNGTRRRNWSIF
jgi:hypothetical protein